MVSLTATNGVQSAGVDASASATIVLSTSVSAACDKSQSTGSQCDSPALLQVVKDGTLNGTQGASLTLTPETDASQAVTATLAYD